MCKKIMVLDKGFVELINVMGGDVDVCRAARVSFNKETDCVIDSAGKNNLSDKDIKLIAYLAKHNHWTPFAHPQITLRIKAPISIRTQFFKSKVGFVENEISRRYVTYEPEIYFPKWRGKPTQGAKQGSEGFLADSYIIDSDYTKAVDNALSVYNNLIKDGVAPEQARFVLPQGTYTEWWWTGSLAAYARVYKQRIDTHAQWEIQEYAKAIHEIIQPLFPHSWKALTAS